MRGSRDFCKSYLVLRGPMVLLLRKLYLYFTKDPEGSIFSRWGVSNFFQGGGGGGSKC